MIYVLFALLFLSCANSNVKAGADMEAIKKNGKAWAVIEAKSLCQVNGASNIAYIGSDSSYHFFQKYDKLETRKNGEILFAVSKPSFKIEFEFDYNADIAEKTVIISKLEGAEFVCNNANK